MMCAVDGDLVHAVLHPSTLAERLVRLRDVGGYDANGLDHLAGAIEDRVHTAPADAAALASVVLTAAEDLGLPAVAARVEYLLARVRAESGDLASALSLITSARTRYEQAGDPLAALRTDLGRMQVLDDLGDHEGAIRPRQRPARLARHLLGLDRGPARADHRACCRAVQPRGRTRLPGRACPVPGLLHRVGVGLPVDRPAPPGGPATRQPGHRVPGSGSCSGGPGRAALGGRRVRPRRGPALGGQVPGAPRRRPPAPGRADRRDDRAGLRQLRAEPVGGRRRGAAGQGPAGQCLPRSRSLRRVGPGGREGDLARRRRGHAARRGLRPADEGRCPPARRGPGSLDDRGDRGHRPVQPRRRPAVPRASRPAARRHRRAVRRPARDDPGASTAPPKPSTTAAGASPWHGRCSSASTSPTHDTAPRRWSAASRRSSVLDIPRCTTPSPCAGRGSPSRAATSTRR